MRYEDFLQKKAAADAATGIRADVGINFVGH